MQKPDPSSIPLSPGVYLYRDGKGQVIYVGKARILRRRVLSYFRPEGLPAKTKAMLAHAQSIEFLTTTTEKEALLLEASLIKKYRPHYNIVLRDDKQYVLFRVNIKHPFPRLFRALHVLAGRPRDLEAAAPGLPPAPLLRQGHEEPRAPLPLPSYGPVPGPLHGAGHGRGLFRRRAPRL